MALTRYKEGSFRELWSISVPLMLTSLSVLAMLFVDRILLANYSTMALNAATNATTLGWSLLVGMIVLTGIAEAFVAQYNGAGNYKKIGEPVWQMIWVAVASVLAFIPIGLWGGDRIYGADAFGQMERDYFNVLMLYGPVHALYTALAAFWIGRGKTFLITALAIVANFVNAGLDVVLIFGIEGVVPSLGVKGAAIATSMGSVFQTIILLVLFLRKKHRQEYGTGRMSFNFNMMKRCLCIGAPNAVFTSAEIVGWAVFYSMMTRAGEKFITIAAVCQSVAILLFFIAEGVGKAVITIAGNMIGAKRAYNVPKILVAGLKLHLAFLALFIVGFYVGSDYIIDRFIDPSSLGEGAAMRHTLNLCLFFTVVYLFFEGLRFLFWGVLTAAGDTVFLMIAGALWIWVILLLPVYVMVMKNHSSIEAAFFMWVVYASSAALIYFGRFLQGKWKSIELTA